MMHIFSDSWVPWWSITQVAVARMGGCWFVCYHSINQSGCDTIFE